MKGVAILLMLFYHLFNRPENVALCSDIIIAGIAGDSLCYILSRAANPVFFFLILSGYGLYISNHREGGDKNRYHRIWTLMKNYWLTLLIFIPIGYLLGKDGYPGNWQTVIENVTAYRVTWNREIWFLFPYVLLALLAPIVVKVVDKVGITLTLLIGCCTTVLSMSVFHFIGEAYIMKICFVCYNPLMLLHFIMPFLVGCCYAKCVMENKNNCPPIAEILNGKWANVILVFSLVLLVTFKCTGTPILQQALYVFAFIWIFNHIQLNKYITQVLQIFGKHSTTIWFIHSYFCYYFFHDVVFSLKYPIVIFFSLAIVSLVVAIVIDTLLKHL